MSENRTACVCLFDSPEQTLRVYSTSFWEMVVYRDCMQNIKKNSKWDWLPENEITRSSNTSTRSLLQTRACIWTQLLTTAWCNCCQINAITCVGMSVDSLCKQYEFLYLCDNIRNQNDDQSPEWYWHGLSVCIFVHKSTAYTYLRWNCYQRACMHTFRRG